MSGENSIVKGPEGLKPRWNTSLGRIFYEALNRHDKTSPFLIDAHSNETYTFGTLLEESILLANIARKWGLGKGSIWGLCSENNIRFYTPIVAALFNGAIITTFNPMYTPAELSHVLNITKPPVIFCSHSSALKLVKLKEQLTYIRDIVVIDGDFVPGTVNLLELLKNAHNQRLADFRPVDGNPAELMAYVLYSSGTTGLPKGVLLSQKNMLVCLMIRNDERYSIRLENDSILGIMPFFHAYGLNVGLYALFVQTKVIVFKKFVDDLFLKAIQDYRINVLLLAPLLAIFLAKSPKILQYDLSSVERIGSGGAPLKKDIVNEVMRRLKVDRLGQAYGMTETTLGVTMFQLDQFKEGSVGKVCPLTEVKIVDSSGLNLGPNQSGEIWVRGPLVMVGYYGNPIATKETINGEGWLKTGDLGYYDQEGYFFIVGRLKELIKYKGYQVAPAELEALILNHPKVRDVGVIGKPDEQCGELPIAFVATYPNVAVTQEEIQEFVKSNLSPQKWLRGGVRFVDDIPKNPSGKILRLELQKMLNSNKSKL